MKTAARPTRKSSGANVRKATPSNMVGSPAESERILLPIISEPLPMVRGNPDAPPIIMITANEGSRHKAYAEYLGVVDYIRKPFAMERLMETIHRVLQASDAAPAGEENEPQS